MATGVCTIAGAQHDLIVTSTDGITWTVVTAITNQTGLLSGDLAYNGSLWVMGRKSRATSPQRGHIWTSTTGTAWTEQSTPIDAVCDSAPAVAYSSTLAQWVASGTDGVAGLGATHAVLLTSPDGVSWTRQATPLDVSGEIDDAVWSSTLGLWVIVGSGSGSYTPPPPASGGWSVGSIRIA